MEQLRILPHYERFRFIDNVRNLGFAAGCNRGITRALSEGCEYVLLLNNDCIIPWSDFLWDAISLAEREPGCGILGGKILFWPETDRIWSTGGYISTLGAERHIGHGEIDRGQYENVAHRKFISGALMLIRRRVIETIGLLPEVYFFGKEEWEYSTRALKAGFTLVYVPSLVAYHEASNSHYWTDPKYVYNGVLSRVLYQKRNRGTLFYHVWSLLFASYVRVLLPLRYRLRRKLFVGGIDARTLQTAMLDALRDSKTVMAITEEKIASYSARRIPEKSVVIHKGSKS